jgi:hypothetical protein
MSEMSDVEFENMAILSFTLFSDFSSLLRQLSVGRVGRPSVADLKGGFESVKFVISSKLYVLRCGATIAVAFVVWDILLELKSFVVLMLSL